MIHQGAKDKLLELLADSETQNILILGGVGVGKTYLAKSVLGDGYFIDEPRFRQEIVSGRARLRGQEEWQTPIDQYPLEALCKYELIVYDDYGTADISPAYIEKVLFWLNERAKPIKLYKPIGDNGPGELIKKTILTSNLSPKEMEQRDKRIYSRIMQNSAVILLEGEDLRRSKKPKVFTF